MTVAYSSCGQTRARYVRSFVWIQHVFRFLLIITKVVAGYMLKQLSLQHALPSLDQFDCRTTPRYLQWSTT